MYRGGAGGWVMIPTGYSKWEMKKLIGSILGMAAILMAVCSGAALAHATAKLKDAHIEFKTADKRKKADTRLVVQVFCNDGSIAAKNDPVQTYGEFPHFSKNGPIALAVDKS